MNKAIKFCYSLLAILGVLLQSGCNQSEEKTYSYYLAHPEELQADYEYCGDHPSKLSCKNVVKMYFAYYKAIEQQGSLLPEAAIDDAVAEINKLSRELDLDSPTEVAEVDID